MTGIRAWLAIVVTGLAALAAGLGSPAAALGQEDEAGSASSAAAPAAASSAEAGSATAASSATAAVAVKPVTAKMVDESVARGVGYLGTVLATASLTAMPPNGGAAPGELEALVVLGLTGAGCEVKEPALRSALEALLATQPESCDTVALRAVALGRVVKKLDDAERRRALAVLGKDLETLVKAQRDSGGWAPALPPSSGGGGGVSGRRSGGYRGEGGGNLSSTWTYYTTRLVLEALAGGERAGIQIKPDAFLKVEKLLLGAERTDGGWGEQLAPYGTPLAELGSLGTDTAAAAAALAWVRRLGYRGDGCPCRSEKSDRRTEKLDAALERGLAWLGEHFSASGNPGQRPKVAPHSWFGACYAAAAATGYQRLGDHDWYRSICPMLVKWQNSEDGSWGQVPDSGRMTTVTWETAQAVSLLHWGRVPVLINKLRFEGPWNNHPADLANLAEFLNEGKKEAARWQVVDEAAKAETWQEAPLLYISAEAPPAFSDEVKQKLRDFTDGGGTILLEASCGDRKAAEAWRKTAAEVWPEWPLAKVERDHPVWTAEAKIVKAVPAFLVLDDGMRSSVFLSVADISCAWATNDVKGSRTLFELGGNVRAYAADGASPAEWSAAREAGPAGRYAKESAGLRAGPRATLTVARAKHGGEWACGMNYQPWAALGTSLAASVSGLVLREAAPVDLAAGAPKGVDCLYLCGRTGCDVGEAGGKALRQYLAGGGFLFVEAAAGDTRFGLAFDVFQNATGLTAKALAAGDPLVTGKFAGGAKGYAIKEVRWSAALAAQMKDKGGIGLEGLYDGEKLVGVYSPYDVMFSQTGCRAWGLRGYAADDARALATNVVMMLTGR